MPTGFADEARRDKQVAIALAAVADNLHEATRDARPVFRARQAGEQAGRDQLKGGRLSGRPGSAGRARVDPKIRHQGPGLPLPWSEPKGRVLARRLLPAQPPGDPTLSEDPKYRQRTNMVSRRKRFQTARASRGLAGVC